MRKNPAFLPYCLDRPGRLLRGRRVLRPKPSTRTTPTRSNATPPAPHAVTQSMLLVTPAPTTTPTPHPAHSKARRDRRRGDPLQTKLQALVYSARRGGRPYGQGTAAAVRLFQSQMGLTYDGRPERKRSPRFTGHGANLHPHPTPSPRRRCLPRLPGRSAARFRRGSRNWVIYRCGGRRLRLRHGEAVRLFQSRTTWKWTELRHPLPWHGLCSDAPPVTITPTPDPATHPLSGNRDNPLDESTSRQPRGASKRPALACIRQGQRDRRRPEAAAHWRRCSPPPRTTASPAGISAPGTAAMLPAGAVNKQVDRTCPRAPSRATPERHAADRGRPRHQRAPDGLAFDFRWRHHLQGTKQQVWLMKMLGYGFITAIRRARKKSPVVAECWHIATWA